MASTSKNLKISSYGAGGSSSKHKANAVATPVSPDADAASTTVHIPFLRTNSKQLHTYTAALQRSADEHLAAEDLDNIQSELELLLSNVAIRYRVLKSEYESLDKDERRNERKHKHNEKQPLSPAPSTLVSTGHTKRKREDGTGSVRKAKHSSSASIKHNKHAKNSPIAQHTDDSMDYLPGTSGGSGGVGISAAGFGLPTFHSHPHGQNRDHHLQKMAVPKNDTPNKFWLSVEPFCMPITNEDLRLLDDLLEQYNGPLVPPIPDLGPHYTSVWAAEDLKEIQQNSNPNHANRLKPQNSNTSNAAGSMLKKAEAALEDSVTGPLTQRLVSALMEEQLLQNPTELAAECSNSSSENTHSSTPLNFRSLSMLRNCVGIEKRIKKELIEQGILDSADFPNNDEDEIQAEIKRLTVELTSVAEYNGSALRRLRETAVEEMKRLEIKRKLDIIDQEILETYKRTMQSKSKRKPLSAEEQQEIYRLTAEQKSLSEQLEQSQASFVPFE